MVTNRDYSAESIKACKSVLIELVNVLSEFRESMAIIGGWVPALLISQQKEQHIGTLDVDVALDFKNILEDTYATILESLQKRGYRRGSQSYTYLRDVSVNETVYTVQVDLLSGEYGGTGRSHRTQRAQDVTPRKARGCDLVFGNTITIEIEGELPGGGLNKIKCQVASAVPWIVMKGMALAGRVKEKDSYDIEYFIRNYSGGLEALKAAFEPHRNNALVVEALSNIRDKFASIGYIGPKHVATFYNLTDPEEQLRRERAAYEVVNDFLAMFSEKVDKQEADKQLDATLKKIDSKYGTVFKNLADR